jgi:hypothetical protein
VLQRLQDISPPTALFGCCCVLLTLRLQDTGLLGCCCIGIKQQLIQLSFCYR